uniref:Uncharacterized protein n=1 Tax=Vespula pensylvanica TaxID=30213 RepID=A0A834NK22_VESPE|nr:hypothetical protein H0235_012891 [Vespula pensylvanica]
MHEHPRHFPTSVMGMVWQNGRPTLLGADGVAERRRETLLLKLSYFELQYRKRARAWPAQLHTKCSKVRLPQTPFDFSPISKSHAAVPYPKPTKPSSHPFRHPPFPLTLYNDVHVN